MFKKAIKYRAKGRVSLIGPAGSGKSYTMLILARHLAGPDGKIACIDTEHGSLSKYADLFDFDVVEMESFSTENFLKALAEAEKAGYDVFCCDSLSHFWVGKDGALEFVDMAAHRHRDKMGGWKDFRPHERKMVDAMIASPCHVLTTMRTKTDYQEQTDPTCGKKKRVKIGLAPVQREGMEYEFDLVGYMEPDDNSLMIEKTRCPNYSHKVLTQPTASDFEPFRTWLEGTERPPAEPKAPPAAAEPPKNVVIISNVISARKEESKKIKGKTVYVVNLKDNMGILSAKTDDAMAYGKLQMAMEENRALRVEYRMIQDTAVIQSVDLPEPAPAGAAS